MFAAMQKRAGFEAITITGRAPQPVYLLVHEHGAEIKAATDLWGQYTQETNHTIRDREPGEVEVLSIGPAGENLVRFACACTPGTKAVTVSPAVVAWELSWVPNTSRLWR